MAFLRISVLALVATAACQCTAFQQLPLPFPARSVLVSLSSRTTATTTLLQSTESSSSENKETKPAAAEAAMVSVETVLKDNYPAFHKLLIKNERIFDTLANDFGDSGYTIFAPSDAAFEALGEKKRAQLEDPRNLETAQKTGLYHVIATEPLSLSTLNREDWTVPKVSILCREQHGMNFCHFYSLTNFIDSSIFSTRPQKVFLHSNLVPLSQWVEKFPLVDSKRKQKVVSFVVW